MLKRLFAGVLIISVIAANLCCTVFASTDNLQNNISVVSEDSGFELKFTGNRSDIVNDLDRINIIVLKPGCDFAAMQSESEVENGIFILKNVLGSEISDSSLFAYSFPSSVQNRNDIDIYPIKVAVTGVDGEYSEANLQYKKISEDYRKQAIKMLSEVTAYDFLDVWTNIASPMFDVSGSESFDKYINLISKQYVLVRNAYFSENSITEFEDLQSIIKCVQMAMSLYSLENSDKSEAEKMISEYGIIFEETYDFSKDFTSFYNLYTVVKDDYKDAENLDYFKKACIMANMQNGSSERTVEEVAGCMRKYSKELKIDLSYATQKNISINKIAARIDTGNISKYYTNSNWFNDLVDEIYAGEVIKDTSSPSKAGGSSGGGSVSVGSAGGTVLPNQNSGEGARKPADSFNDLAGYEWAKDAIEYLYKNSVVSGDGDGSFSPARNITREEFVKMLCAAFDIYTPADSSEIVFEDVNYSDWFYPYVCVAKANGIVNGKSETLFGTGENITRQDMACMLYNLLLYKNINIVPDNSEFSDSDMISHYSVKAVDTLTSIGIISGFDDNSFRPFENADRAQAAKMIYNMVLYLN